MDLYAGTAASGVALLKRAAQKVTEDEGLKWIGAEKQEELFETAKERLENCYSCWIYTKGSTFLISSSFSDFLLLSHLISTNFVLVEERVEPSGKPKMKTWTIPPPTKRTLTKVYFKYLEVN